MSDLETRVRKLERASLGWLAVLYIVLFMAWLFKHEIYSVPKLVGTELCWTVDVPWPSGDRTYACIPITAKRTSAEITRLQSNSPETIR